MSSRQQERQQKLQRKQQELKNCGQATKIIHSGQCPEDNECQAIVTPIVTSVTYKQNEPGAQKGCVNSLRCNPTRESLEDTLATLENAKCVVTTPSGLSALALIVTLLKSGDQIIVDRGQFIANNKNCKNLIKDSSIQIETVDTTNAKEVEGAIKQNTRLIILETSTNPLMKIADIEQVVKIARKKQKGDNATQRILVAVENSVLTPALQKPLDLGADLSVNALTKFTNGHNDVIMGSVATNDDELEKQLRNLQETIGLIPSPFDCSLVERSLKTLIIRLEQIEKTTLKIAKQLEQNSQVEKVHCLGLNSHPHNDLNKRQAKGCPGLFSFIVKGNGDTAKRVIKNLKVVINAEFSGGCETTACIPAITTTTFKKLTQDERENIGVQDNLIQISIGLEDSNDLLQDLEQALKNAK